MHIYGSCTCTRDVHIQKSCIYDNMHIHNLWETSTTVYMQLPNMHNFHICANTFAHIWKICAYIKHMDIRKLCLYRGLSFAQFSYMHISFVYAQLLYMHISSVYVQLPYMHINSMYVQLYYMHIYRSSVQLL